MPDFAVDDTGVSVETLAERVAKFNAALQDPANFGPGFSVAPSEPVPMLCAIMAEPIVQLQGAIKAIKDATTPGAARGIHADDVGALTNTSRLPATASTIPIQLTGTANETIPSGRTFTHNGSGTTWTTTVAVALNGSGIGTTVATATTTGPIAIAADDDWSIVLGDADLTSVESTGKSTPGRDVESDGAYETRRESEIGGIGKSTFIALEANLRAALIPSGASSVRLRHNTSSVTVDGLPPKSYEVIIDDGGSIADNTIAAHIIDNAPLGIQSFGTSSGVYTYENGDTETVWFTRVSTTDMHIRITVDTTGAESAIPDRESLSASIRTAVVEFGNSLPPGRDVVPPRYAAVAFAKVPHGQATNVTAERSTDGATWFSTVLAIDSDDAAVFATVRVTVLYTP